MLRVFRLAKAAVGKSVQQSHRQAAAHHAVQSCCQAASCIATKNVHVHLLQQVHGECVHLITHKEAKVIAFLTLMFNLEFLSKIDCNNTNGSQNHKTCIDVKR